MDRTMRQWRPLLLLLCFVSSSSLLVSSQTTSSSDSCTAALSLGNLIPFNTTGLTCFQAWSSQGFILRFGKEASSGSNNMWNFVLSAPDSGGYIAVGFSPNGKMVGSSAVAGWVTPNGAGTARQYYLGGTTSSSCPPDQGKLSLSRGAGAAPTIFGTMTMDRTMRQWRPLLLLLCFVSSSSLLVSSQTTSSSDSCTAALSLGNLIPFNTTGLTCFQAWSSQGFILRFGKEASSGSNNMWNFVLSAPDSGGYIAVGFSPNGKMVGSSAVAGWVTPNGAGTARQYYLGGTTSSSCPPDQGKLSLSRGAGAAPTIVSKGSRLYLAFQLSGQPLTNVIYAVGPAGSLPGPSGLLAQHKDMAAGTISLSGGSSGGGGTPATGGGGDGDEGHEGHEGGEGKGNSDQSGGVGGESGSDGNGGRSTTTTTTASASSSGSASARVFCAQWTKCSVFVQMVVYFVLFSGTIFL
uniref:DOMON domain-containing protein n=1 Tax=Oryza punctata TaxID=4537 RepID=A0A0E0JS33_ORYPU